MSIDIVSFSASTLPGSEPTIAHEHTVKKFLKNNIIVVVAAGNCGPLSNTINLLSGFKGVITVGSCNKNGDKLSSFSSRGVRGTELKPTIITYGEEIFAKTKTRNDNDYTPEEIQNDILKIYGQKIKVSEDEAKYYEKESGTSFSTAIVTGYIGRILAVRKALHLDSPPLLIKDILENIAIPMEGYKEHEVGSGFISYKLIQNYFRSIDNSLFPNLYWEGYKGLEKMWINAKGEGIIVFQPDNITVKYS